MKKRTKNRRKNNLNLRLKPLNYSKNKNSFWRFEIFKNFNLCFKPDQFKANLGQINQLAKSDKQYLPFSKFYSHYWDIYESSINNFGDFYSDSATLLSQTIPFEDGEKCLSFKKVRQLVKKHLASSTTPWVIISDDHRISHATIKELTSQNKIQTAIIVIDNHVDIYGPGPAKNNPLKFNPFRNLIESGTAKHIFFLCPSFKELLSDKSSWKDIAKSVSFIPFISSNQGMKFNQKKFETTLACALKQKSIKNIFFSIDIDALADNRQNIIYSAFEYSILNSILYLSLLSNKQIQKYEYLSTCLIDLTKIFHKKIKSSKIARIRNPYKPQFNTVNESGITPLVYCDTIQKIGRISKKIGLTIGLGSCIGEVVELMGPDWKGETTKATIQIVNSLNNLSQIHNYTDCLN